MIIAIVVLYNPDKDTIRKQYLSLIGEVDEIVYIDNGSNNYYIIHDELIQSSVKGLPQFFIHNYENIGLGAAQNQGINLAKERGAEFILLLDHDSILRCNFISCLLTQYTSLSKHFKIGAVGPVYINEDTNETYPITRYWGPFIKRLKPSSIPIEASCLIASGSLIPVNVLTDVGFMNEDLFVDYIDIEWSYRTRFRDYHLFAVPDAIMNHKIGDKRISFLGRKISMHSPIRRYFLARNSIYMLKCPYISCGYKIRETCFNLMRIIIFSLLSSEKGKYLKYSIKGLYDGLRGRFGKSSI